MNRFAWASPRTLAEASAAASTTVADVMAGAPPAARDEAAVIKAGGIDLIDLLKEGLLAPQTLVNLRDVPGLDAVAEADGGGLRIGAMARLTKLAANADVRRRYPALADAVAHSASRQIRNSATLGGNLLQRPRCWYFRSSNFHCLRKGGGHCFAIAGENQYHAIFDNHLCAIVHPSTAATALVALGARVELAAAGDGATRQPLLEEFLVAPGRDVQRENDLKPHEILTAVHLPRLPAGVRMAHMRQGEKESFDWPLADVAVVLDVAADGRCANAAIVLGAAAPVPYRAKAAQLALVGRRVDEAAAARAAVAAVEGATPLSGNAYKLPLFETMVRRAILKAIKPDV